MSILQGLDPATLAEHFGEVDLEYTWPREQTPSEAETLRAELQFQRQQVQDLAKVAEYYRALVQEARDERDAATRQLEIVYQNKLWQAESQYGQDSNHYKFALEEFHRLTGKLVTIGGT